MKDLFDENHALNKLLCALDSHNYFVLYTVDHVVNVAGISRGGRFEDVRDVAHFKVLMVIVLDQVFFFFFFFKLNIFLLNKE